MSSTNDISAGRKSIPTDLSASVMVINKNNTWVPDRMVSNCYKCGDKFGYLLRKHHCRSCGNVFCHKCTNNKIEIPDFVTDIPDARDTWNLSYYVPQLKGEKEKVCSSCYNLIETKKNTRERIISTIANPLCIDRIKELSASEEEVKRHYFDHLRNIQYYLPNHKYSELDIKLLRVNAHYFGKHSKYFVHLIKSIDWSDMKNKQLNLELIVGIINSDKNKQCNELYCTRTCQEQLSCDDAINILYSCVQYIPDTLLEYLFNIIIKTPPEIILCHLTFFISLVKVNATNKILDNYLSSILTQTLKLTYHTYWFLINAKESATVAEMSNINNFLKNMDHSLVEKMDSEYNFYKGLIDNLEEPVRYLINKLNDNPISLPYEPDIKIIGVFFDQIETKTSYTKPVIIPFETTVGKIRLLFKRESIMNDFTVLNLMSLCDIILGENLNGLNDEEDNPNKKFSVVFYPTMPLTPNSGMIEIVDNAETVYNIGKKNKTILEHIVFRNEKTIIANFLDRYLYSLVSYTLHSYFLGLGDRHLQNIMITDEGQIFHIDFGFILGSESYPLSGTEIKLNSDMLDVIGGKDSNRYDIYLELCTRGVIILRKYFNIFFILLSQDSKFSGKHIENFVLTRFQPRQVDNIIVSELMQIIKQCHDAYTEKIRDFLHFHTQEKTVQDSMGNAISTLKSLLTVVTGIKS